MFLPRIGNLFCSQKLKILTNNSKFISSEQQNARRTVNFEELLKEREREREQ
jgi:hypothetical protein